MLSNTKLNRTVAVLFISGRKLSISLVFMTQSYLAIPKDVRLNSTYYFIMKISNKEELNKLQLMIHQIMTLKT